MAGLESGRGNGNWDIIGDCDLNPKATVEI